MRQFPCRQIHIDLSHKIDAPTCLAGGNWSGMEDTEPAATGNITSDIGTLPITRTNLAVRRLNALLTTGGATRQPAEHAAHAQVVESVAISRLLYGRGDHEHDCRMDEPQVAVHIQARFITKDLAAPYATAPEPPHASRE